MHVLANMSMHTWEKNNRGYWGMATRTNGNLALNPAYKPDYQPTQKNLRKKSIKPAANPKSKTVNIAVALFYLIVIFALAFFLVGREVNLYEQSSEISQLNATLEKKQAANKQAMLVAEQSLDLGNIEQVATEQFGMIRPEKHQTVYVNIQQGDYVEKVADKDLGEVIGQNLSDGVKNLFGIFNQ